MSNHGPHSRLAELVRRGEWLLDDAAHEIGWQRYSPQQCREVAGALDELSAALREHAATLPSEGREPREADLIEGNVDD